MDSPVSSYEDGYYIAPRTRLGILFTVGGVFAEFELPPGPVFVGYERHVTEAARLRLSVGGTHLPIPKATSPI